MDVDDNAAVVLSPGQKWQVRVLTSASERGSNRQFSGTRSLPHSTYAFDTNNSPSFSIAGETVTATDLPGDAVLSAVLPGTEPPVSCLMRLSNPGPTPAGLPVVVIDAVSGRGIEGAVLVVDVDGDGVDDAGAFPTDPSGYAVVPFGAAVSSADYTFLAPGYDPLTLVGIGIAEVSVVRAALSAVPTAEPFAWFASRVSMDATVASGGTGLIRSPAGEILRSVALSGASLPLTAFAAFGDDLLVPGAWVDCRHDPRPPGCLTWTLSSGPVSLTLEMPLADNEIARPLQGEMDALVRGQPGVRLAWSLAGGGPDTLEWYANIDFAVHAIGCNTTMACDATDLEACPRDIDCPDNVDSRDLSQLWRYIAPSISFASAVTEALVLQPSLYPSSWTNPGTLRQGDSINPLVDAVLSDPINRFSAVALPIMPLDPARTDGRFLQTLILLTGTNVPGAGFVPLGFGVGFTCGRDQLAPPGICPDPAATDPTLRSRSTCWQFGNTTVCPDNIPNPLPDGSIVLQSAAPHSGLQGYPEVMIALANAHRVYSDDLSYRGAGLLAHRGPNLTTDDAFANTDYPSFPNLPAAIPGRAYALSGDASFDLHWIVIGDDPRDPTAVRWHIFAAASDTRSYNLPTLPAILPDPFDTTGAPLVVRHTTLRLNPGETLSTLAASGGLAPARLFDHVAGFATRRAEIPRQ